MSLLLGSQVLVILRLVHFDVNIRITVIIECLKVTGMTRGSLGKRLQ